MTFRVSPTSWARPFHLPQRHSAIVHRVFYCLLYLLAFIFILLVQVGNLSDKAVLRQTYFLKIDLSHIIPQSVPDAVLLNSIARSIGLHDFYQVGLWNFCEGYGGEGEGITYCSSPEKMYFFNPVEILLNELLAGATIALPADILQALDIARTVSHWMFALFLTSIILIFLCVVLTPLSVSSSPPSPDQHQQEKRRRAPLPKRLAFPFVFLTFFAFFTTIIASILATAMFTIFSVVFTNNAADLNVSAELGVRMLVFMWIAVGLTAVGFFFQARNLCGSCRRCCFLLCCCCCLPFIKKRPSFAKRSRGRGVRNGDGDGGDRDAGDGDGAGAGGGESRVEEGEKGSGGGGMRNRGNHDNNDNGEKGVSRRWRAMRFGL